MRASYRVILPVLVSFLLSGCCCLGEPSDRDHDGTADIRDCAPDDASIATAKADDADCDGVVKAADCDDKDAANRSDRNLDKDCDGAADDDDCAPDDAKTSTIRSADRDCDGVVDAQDCDPDGHIGDSDCDGVVDAEDCAPGDASVTRTRAGDADCDGVADSDDCDPGDAAVATTKAADRDCDGISNAKDCDPDGRVGDRDCDDIPDGTDCDPDGHVGDRDCDGTTDRDDCEPDDAANDLPECAVHFHGKLEALCADFKAADNEIKKGQVVDSTRKLLRAAKLTNVSGKLTKINANRDASGVDIVIDVGNYQFVSDAGLFTESFMKGSSIYNTVSNMKEGGCVVFSARSFTAAALAQSSEVCGKGFSGRWRIIGADFTSVKACGPE